MTNHYTRLPQPGGVAPRRWFAWPPAAWAAASATAGLLVAMAVASHRGSWIVVLLVPFALVSVALAAIDIRWRVIPNRLVLPALVAAIALASLTGLADGDAARVLGALAGGAGLFAVYLVPALIAPSAMGFGDVKLAALVGAVLGTLGVQDWLVGTLAGFIVGAVIGVVGLVSRRLTLQSRVPFAPAMLAGAWLPIVLAPVTQ